MSSAGAGISTFRLTRLPPRLSQGQKAVVLTGEARGQISDALTRAPDFDPEKLPVVTEPLFDDAVRTAKRLAKEGDTVLLSPACTSFDAFRNFEERGNRFRDLVNGFPDD